MSKVLVTGATGLIGKALVKKLLKEGNSVIAIVRDKQKAISIFGEEDANLKYLLGDITTITPKNIDIDYIIHGASQTSSKAFVSEPVETSITALLGTMNMLEMGKLNNVKGFVFLSSMEVYGYPKTDELISENYLNNTNTMEVRTCYPESKRMCENLCASYFSEYGIPTKVIRLTQTFGPGVKYDDNRVFAQFARCIIENKNIVLKTKGETKRSYLYTDDAVNAILTVMYKGKSGEAYNAANETTYCSIYEMASLIINKFGNSNNKIIIEEETDRKNGYAPTLHMNLNTSKLQKLGWSPSVDLEKMYYYLIEDMKKSKSKIDN